MFWQIYCITSWTAPPVDWQDVPAHSHFYIKSLLYFFNWNILMCFASLILCINSVLRDLKPCTVRARSNVLDSLLDLWRGREKNASRVLGVVTRKRKKKTYHKCAKNQPLFCMSFGENSKWSVLFLRVSLGSMLSVLADCCKGGPNLHAHFSLLLWMYI